jgi:hypothetical protein
LDLGSSSTSASFKNEIRPEDAEAAIRASRVLFTALPPAEHVRPLPPCLIRFAQFFIEILAGIDPDVEDLAIRHAR